MFNPSPIYSAHKSSNHIFSKKHKISPDTQENGTAGSKKDKTERVMRLDRITREEIVKWNKMTALRFKTGGRHQTYPASLRGSIKR